MSSVARSSRRFSGRKTARGTEHWQRHKTEHRLLDKPEGADNCLHAVMRGQPRGEGKDWQIQKLCSVRPHAEEWQAHKHKPKQALTQQDAAGDEIEHAEGQHGRRVAAALTQRSDEIRAHEPTERAASVECRDARSTGRLDQEGRWPAPDGA